MVKEKTHLQLVLAAPIRWQKPQSILHPKRWKTHTEVRVHHPALVLWMHSSLERSSWVHEDGPEWWVLHLDHGLGWKTSTIMRRSRELPTEAALKGIPTQSPFLQAHELLPGHEMSQKCPHSREANATQMGAPASVQGRPRTSRRHSFSIYLHKENDPLSYVRTNFSPMTYNLWMQALSK